MSENDTAWHIDSTYFIEIATVMMERQDKVDLQFTDVIDEMAKHTYWMNAPVREDNVEIICEATQKFYMQFALLIKFLYPIMEQVETVVQNNIRLKKHLDKKVDE